MPLESRESFLHSVVSSVFVYLNLISNEYGSALLNVYVLTEKGLTFQLRLPLVTILKGYFPIHFCFFRSILVDLTFSTQIVSTMTLEDSQRSSESDYLIDTSNLQLNRKLTSRHIQMIAIGGTIGTGLFLGSGATIAKAGPLGALIGYSIVGSMVYSIMTSLGELATHYPISGSFSTYAGKYVDPALGFALGWNYWFQWAISFPSELSAAGLIVDFWFPNFPKYFTPLAILLFLVSIHLFGVERFGETEYWLSLIKVVAIVLFIAAGFAVDFGLLGNSPIYLKNWVIEGAPFKNGNLI